MPNNTNQHLFAVAHHRRPPLHGLSFDHAKSRKLTAVRRVCERYERDKLHYSSQFTGLRLTSASSADVSRTHGSQTRGQEDSFFLFKLTFIYVLLLPTYQ
jgi:hypothetical protein